MSRSGATREALDLWTWLLKLVMNPNEATAHETVARIIALIDERAGKTGVDSSRCTSCGRTTDPGHPLVDGSCAGCREAGTASGGEKAADLNADTCCELADQRKAFRDDLAAARARIAELERENACVTCTEHIAQRDAAVAAIDAERAAHAETRGKYDVYRSEMITRQLATLNERDIALRDLAAERERSGRMREALESIRDDWHTAHNMHWDRAGTGGTNCPACKLDYAVREIVRSALSDPPAAKKEQT